MKFNGSDYDHNIDSVRLTEQHLRIKKFMGDDLWHTLGEISKNTGDPEASISAQLRHLRKPRFGSYVIEKRARANRENGLFEYRLRPKGFDSEYVVTARRNKYREALTAVWNHKDCTTEIKGVIREIFKKGE